LYLVFGIGITLAIGLYQYSIALKLNLVPEEFRLIVFGASPNPLFFAALISPITIYTFGLFPSTNKWKGIFFGAIFLLSTLILIATLSRSVWIAITIGIFLLLVTKRRQIKLNFRPFLLIFGATLLIILINLPLIKGRINNSNIKSTQSFASINRRLAIWDSAFKTFKDNPLFGQGNGTFEWSINKHRNLALNQDPTLWESPFFAENFIVRLFVENGLIGGIPFLIFLCLFTKKISKNKIGLIASLVYFICGLQAEIPLFILFILLSLSLSVENEINNPQINKVFSILAIILGGVLLFFNLKTLFSIIITPYPQTYLTYVDQESISLQLSLAKKGISINKDCFHVQAALFNRTTNMLLWGKETPQIPSFINTNNPQVLLGQVRLSVATRQYDKSKQIIKKMLLLDPNNPAVYNLLGIVKNDKNYFIKAISLKEDYYPAIHNFGVITKSEDQLKLAKKIFEKYYHFPYFPDQNTFDY
jgi:5-bromo-4-chloroindolyl phosphate hydrolysis protein